MSRKGAVEITGEEVVRISQLLAEAKSLREIEKETGRSASAICRIREGLGYPKDEARGRRASREEVEIWLKQNWNWKRPENQKPQVKKRKTDFRTPYNTRR